MKITKSLQQRIVIALDRGQTRIRCLEAEYDDAVHFGIVDPSDKTMYVMAFSGYVDTKGGFFAVFSNAFVIAARKAWKIKVKGGDA